MNIGHCNLASLLLPRVAFSAPSRTTARTFCPTASKLSATTPPTLPVIPITANIVASTTLKSASCPSSDEDTVSTRSNVDVEILRGHCFLPTFVAADPQTRRYARSAATSQTCYSHTSMPLAYIALGSNLPSLAGHPDATLAAALPQLASIGRITKRSGLYSTAPVGLSNQPQFLNAVVVLDTALTPRTLLAALLFIERLLGRDRAAAVPNGPRTLDLDILLYGDLILSQPGLEIPHPRSAQHALWSCYPSPKLLPISAIRVPVSPLHNSSPISPLPALLQTPLSPSSNRRSGPPHNFNPPLLPPNPPLQVTGLVLCPLVVAAFQIK